jgi:murein DD-endopeptidase MepM/ murein hydrolase activator NlpD
MNRLGVATAIALTLFGLASSLVANAAAESNVTQAKLVTTPAAWPLQLEMRVPFEPTAFPSAGRNYLMYELYLTNFGMAPLSLRRIDVLDADVKTTRPIATFEQAQLDTMLQSIGPQVKASGHTDRYQLSAGSTLVVFISIALDGKAAVPMKLFHRVTITGGMADGAIIDTHHTKLLLLGPPVEGTDWLASDGPSNDQENHHRRGIFLVDSRVVISRRYAIDWLQARNGANFSGNKRDYRSYYAYAKPVLAVADGTVVTAKDGLPDNVPGHDNEFHPAVPITMDTVAGNTITLDLGAGQFAYYMHLQPGSLRVRVGEHVRRGQLLARIGASGDAREPHLHFEITTSPKLMAGEGVPYLIDKYRVMNAPKGIAAERTGELPLDNMAIDFGDNHIK